MPILDVEIIGEIENKNIAQSLADAAGLVFETHKGNVWVKIHYLPKNQYAENDNSSENSNPVFVSVLLGQSYGKKDQGKVAIELTDALSKVIGRPKENIHILFEPNAMGRIAFGGKLLTEK